jgi:ATP-dependent DNA ligase
MLLRQRARPGLGTIELCLPSPAKAPPSGPGWLHEIKHDGFRILARRDRKSPNKNCIRRIPVTTTFLSAFEVRH